MRRPTIVLCCVAFLAWGCGGGSGGESGEDSIGKVDTVASDSTVLDNGQPRTDARTPTSCITIDRVESKVYPPSAVRVTFRVLDCNGYPVRKLDQVGDVVIINDEKGLAFGDGEEGGGQSAADLPSEFGFYSILALDMSDSIFNNNAVDSVIDGAQVFVKKMVVEPEPDQKHQVALLVFGRTDTIQVVLAFTDDATALHNKLEELRGGESLGTTNLYGAYMKALKEVLDVGKDLDLVERSVVILTDGTHEAGAEDELRQQALDDKKQAEDTGTLNVFSIGIKGNYAQEKLKELASKPDYFALADNAASLEDVFKEVAERVEAIAHSNYVVGVCTPVELGSPTMTIRVNVDGVLGEVTVDYATDELHGDVASCNKDIIANPCKSFECGPGALPGFACGTCDACGTECLDGLCTFTACEGKACGDDVCGGSCGECGCGEECQDQDCIFMACKSVVCGDDGCEGSCGDCGCGEDCQEGQCLFTACDGKTCGDDGCGGTCGKCGCGEDCQEGQCLFTACDGKECGTDGCGGSCGDCECGICQVSHCQGAPETCDGLDNNCNGEIDELWPNLDLPCDGDDLDMCQLGAWACAGEGNGIECVEDPELDACKDAACGDDGCGGSCGECSCGEDCQDGQCHFAACDGKECGIDGCGGSCGECGCGEDCQKGQCHFTACGGKECGTDGCGGSCGDCPGGKPVCAMNGLCVENYEGTWLDQVSGLTWQIMSADTTMNWATAKTYCANLDLAGGGWHLPTIGDLRSLIRGCAKTQSEGTCNVDDDKCLATSCRDSSCDGCSSYDGPGEGGMYWPVGVEGECCWYWSSSSVEDSASNAWGVPFQYGGVYTVGHISNTEWVRCVR